MCIRDRNLPARLDASYVDKDGTKKVPVMLHRALFGSLERFIGILIENYAGKLPFWLAARQVVVASIITDANGYCNEIVDALKVAGIKAESDLRNEKISYKVREHSLAKVPIILAIGNREVNERTITVRKLGEKHTETLEFDQVILELKKECVPPDIR